MPSPSQSSVPDAQPTLSSARSSLVDCLRSKAQGSSAYSATNATTPPPLPAATPAQNTHTSAVADRVVVPDVVVDNETPDSAKGRRIHIVGMAQRVHEAAGLKADQAINKRFEKYRQSSFTTSPGILATIGRVATAPWRANTYKAAWLRMTADAERAALIQGTSKAVFAEMTTESERASVLTRIAGLDGHTSYHGTFGEQRIHGTRQGERAELALRDLATSYLVGELSADAFDQKKSETLAKAGVQHVVDTTRTVLDDIRGGRTLTRDEAAAALKDISFAIWNDSTAAGEKLRRGFGDRLVAACHSSRLLGSVPGITACTALLVSIGVYLAKGGFGTRQLAIGAASGMGTSFALGAAIASTPVISGLIIGTAVASLFSYLRKGRELKKDLHQVRTEKVLGRHRSQDQEPSRKDKHFRQTFMNSKALNVTQRIADLATITDPEALAQAIGETEAALALQNEPNTRANTLDYTDPSQVARERMELLRALAHARRTHEGHGHNAETHKALDAKREAAKATFLQDFAAAQNEVNGSFTSYRMREQAKSLATTLLIGGVFYGAGRAVDAIQEHWGQTSSGVGETTSAHASQASPHSESSSATPSSPATPQVVQHTVITPPPIDLNQLPAGVTRDPSGDIIVDSSIVDLDVLRDLQNYQPNFSTVQIQTGTPAHDVTRSITESLTSTDVTNGVRGGTLGREYYYDNGTTTFDKNELRLHWGGAGRRGVDGDGNIVYSVSKMFHEDSYFFQRGTKVSLDVGDAVTHGAARTAQQGHVEMVLRLDANNPNEIIRIPIQPDGSVVIPDEVRNVAYRVNARGQAEYIGWKASIGLVAENSDGTISFGEIATDFGAKKLNGASVRETIDGSNAVYQYRFPQVTETREDIVDTVVPPLTVPPHPEPQTSDVAPLPAVTKASSPERRWIFPFGWDDHRDALGTRDNVEKETKEPANPPRVDPENTTSAPTTTPPAGDPSQASPSDTPSVNTTPVTPASSDGSSGVDQATQTPTPDPFSGLVWTKASSDDDEQKRLAALESNLDSILRANPRKVVEPQSNWPWYTEEVQYYTGPNDAPEPQTLGDLQPGMVAILRNDQGELLGIACIQNPAPRSGDHDTKLFVVVDYLRDGPEQHYTSLKSVEDLASQFGVTKLEFLRNLREDGTNPEAAQPTSSFEPQTQATPAPSPEGAQNSADTSEDVAIPANTDAELPEAAIDEVIRPEKPKKGPPSKHPRRAPPAS